MTSLEWKRAKKRPWDWRPNFGEPCIAWHYRNQENAQQGKFIYWHWEDDTITVLLNTGKVERFAFWIPVITD